MSRSTKMRSLGVIIALVATLSAAAASPAITDTVYLRGRRQLVHVYGSRGSGSPVIVSSGDGGWIHLAPHVAEVLATAGLFVVGVDTRAYLESFTSGTTTLKAEDEPGDYRALVDYAARGSTRKPVLI